MPPPKDYIKIQYPRRCEHCEYVANNPQMWHYHNRTHAPIPLNKMCDHGCGKPALFRGTGGKCTCVKNSFTCVAYVQKHSDRVKEQWKNDSDRRKEMSVNNPMKDNDTKAMQSKRQSKTKREQYSKTHQMDLAKANDFKYYSRYIRSALREKGKEWALSQGYTISKNTYHVDHKLSVFDAWKARLPENIVNHPMNLQVIRASENLSKGRKSLITPEELMESIKTSSEQE